MARKKAQKDEELIQMTQASYDELVKELEFRKTTERENIAKEISAARELGDLSENHAYTVAMEKKDINENRISDLESLIKNVQIVKTSSSTSLVTIGSKVQITNLKTKKSREVTLTGSEQTEAADPSEGKVSKDSPIGSAILNARKGDIVHVKLPIGTVEYKIDKVA
ncbi:transcription elongation factor GreA [Candidatus Dojkabacteria bacterium]|uniref:Transcription elongation factor GreA n=1 Tax=Candidatus Dojkabacteria bacterium TaxID=2099670 RepID=A0A955RL35_9BACT|nr:transcription elongation factor GreA [Candidatus Dojkabacteria bacterium]